MAIVFEKEKKTFNWFAILLTIVIVAIVGAAAYYLFFAPSPKIEAIIPAELQRAGEVSQIDFTDPSFVVNSQAYKNLRLYVGMPVLGALGRNNPFLPF